MGRKHGMRYLVNVHATHVSYMSFKSIPAHTVSQQTEVLGVNDAAFFTLNKHSSQS